MSNLVGNYQPIVNFSENSSICYCTHFENYYCHSCTRTQMTSKPNFLECFNQLEIADCRSRNNSLTESLTHNRSSPNLLSLSPTNCLSDSHGSADEAYDTTQSSTCPRRQSQLPNLSMLRECLNDTSDDSSWQCEKCYKSDQFPFSCEKCMVVLCNSCASKHVLDANTNDHLVSRISKAPISQFSAAVGSEIRSPIRRVFENELPSSLSAIGRHLEQSVAMVPFNSTVRHSIMDEVIQPLPDTSFITQVNVDTINKCGHNLLNDYCTNCSILLCSNCREEHKSHEILSLLGSQDIFHEIFRNLLNESDSRAKEVSSALNVTEDIFQLLETAESRTTNSIETAFSNIINVLNVRKKSLISIAKTITLRKKETLSNQIKILQQSQKKIMAIQRAAKSSLHCKSILEQVELHGKVQMEMKSLDPIRMFQRPHENETLSFFSPMAELCRNLISFGRIDCCGHAKFTYPYGVNMYNVIIGWISQISVQSVCPSGEKRLVGGDDIKAFVYDERNEYSQLNVQDHGTGIYTIRFRLVDFSKKTICVTIRDQYIMNVPITPTINSFEPYRNRRIPTLKLTNGIKRPWGVHCDGDGNLYVTDRTNHCIHIFNYLGNFVHKFGSYGNLPGYFNRPAGITVDSNRRIIVTDKDNHRVQIFTSGGEFLLTFGQSGDDNGQFRYPWGVDVDHRGNIVVADSRNYRIQLFDSIGNHLKSVSSNPTSMHALKDLDGPRGVCCAPNGQVFVTDFNRHRIVVISKDFSSSSNRYFGKEGSGSEGFFRPQGIAIDSYGNVLIVDTRNRRVCVYSLYGIFLCDFALGEPENYRLHQPKRPAMVDPLDIAISPDGHIFVSEFTHECVFRF